MNAPLRVQPPPRRSPVESFGRDNPTTHRQTGLSEHESEDLRYLWQGYSADLGIKSAHGALERRLLMSPPRDTQKPVLDELERAGGRLAEGRVVRLVVLEGWGTRREVKRAIAYLTRPSAKRGPRVERIAVPRPEASKAHNEQQGRCDHGCAACEWTGWDLRLTERGEIRMQLALGSVASSDPRGDRWARIDARLQEELCVMAVKSATPHAPSIQEETLGARQRRAVNRATAALSKVTAFDAHVLQVVYGAVYASEEAEIEAVRKLVGGDRAKAESARESACRAYREARRPAASMEKRPRKARGLAMVPRVRVDGVVLGEE